GARIKVPQWPIVSEKEQAEVINGLEMVDFVCSFDEDNPLQAILKIRPDVLVKGADWTGNIVGQSEVERWNGKVVALPLIPGCSTTAIVDRVLARYGDSGKMDS